MEVIAVNLKTNETTADRQYWATHSEFEESLIHNRFFRMILLDENMTDKLKLDDLFEHGLKGVPQGALKVREPLLSYIHSVL